MVCSEPAERILDRAEDVVGFGALAFVVQLAAEFSGDHDAIPATPECLAEKLFALPLAVNVGGIQEVDPGIECCVYHASGRGRVDAPAEIIAAETHNGNFERTDFALF